MRVAIRTFLLFAAVLPALPQTQAAWITRSNRNTQILIDPEAKYSPESAAEHGVQCLDDQITVLAPSPDSTCLTSRERLRTWLASARGQIERAGDEPERKAVRDAEGERIAAVFRSRG